MSPKPVQTLHSVVDSVGTTQLGSDVPIILKAPVLIEPGSPAIPEDLGNVFLSPTARCEPSSTGWYVRWNGCGAYIGTPDGRKRSALKGMAIIERLLMSQGKSMSTAQLRGCDEPLYVFGESTWSRSVQEFGLDGDTPPSEVNGFQVGRLVPEQADETRDLRRQLDLALELIRAKLPLLADHLSQRISIPLKSDRTWRYADDETQWTFGFGGNTTARTFLSAIRMGLPRLGNSLWSSRVYCRWI